MEDEVKNVIVMLIAQNNKFGINDIDVEPNIDIKEFKYSLVDNYSSMEAIDLKINIELPCIKEPKYYKNQEEFAKDVKVILTELANIDFNFNSIEVYSYRKDGNWSYSFRLEEYKLFKSRYNKKKSKILS